MKHLFHPSVRDPANLHDGASPLFQLMMQLRSKVDAGILRQGLAAGWLGDPNEVGPTGLPLLLGYLGTFDAVPDQEAPGWTVAMLETRVRGAAWEREETLGATDGDTPDGPGRLFNTVRLALELLERGANPWLQDAEGRDAFDQVASLMWIPVWDAMVQRPDAPDAEQLAGRRQTVVLTTREGNVQRTLPWLHAAVALERPGWLARLVPHGLSLEQRDPAGRTPLFHAQSPAMVQTLLDLGADLFALDAQGQPVSATWNREVRTTVALNAMNRLVQPRFDERFANDPQALLNLHRPTLYDLATGGTKDSVVTFMRGHGFTASDRWTAGGPDSTTVSLLGHTALGSLLAGTDRQATLQHLIERADDPWFASVADVPDVFLVWAVSQGHGTLARATEQVLRERYGWEHNGAAGFVAFVASFVPAMERLTGHLEAQGHTDALARLGGRVGQLLTMVVYGRTDHVSGKALDRWKNLAKVNPSITVGPSLSVQNARAAVTERFCGPEWEQAQDPQGMLWVWRWASAGMNGVHLDPAHPDEVSSPLRGLLGEVRQGQGQRRETPPRVPYDRMAMHVLLALLGNGPSQLDTIQQKVLANGWDRDEPVRHAMQQALADGVRLDSDLPGFETRLQRVRERYPALAQTLENEVLSHVLEGADPLPASRPRTRL